MKASDLFVKALENEGVEYIFGIPGEENLDILNSLKNSKIKLILTRHEQGAGFMAATYGRLTGKVGVCMATLGPGATNLVTPAAYAQLGGMPILMITGQKPIKKSKQGAFQIVDIVEMMKPLTKFTKQIVNGNTIPALVREAFRVAAEERPGAVHLELPEDIAAEETDASLLKVHSTRRPVADKEALLSAMDKIEKAKSPLILVGAGANRKLIAKHIVNFIQKTGIPFVNTQMGKGIVSKVHDYYIGTAALSDKDYVHCAIAKADLIINIGHDVIEKPPFFMEHGGTEVIHMNFFSAKVDDVYFPQIEVIGDIGNTLKYISEKITPQKSWDFSYFMKTREHGRKHIQEKANDPSFPILPQRLVADTRKAMPENGVICLDNGMYKLWYARNYICYDQNTILLDNALATMGAGLPSAMATKLVHPEKKVMAICGDGGFMMNSQEIETAVRMKLDIVVLIILDNAYGMIKWKQAGMDFDEFGLDYGNPDFVKYAESYGAHGHFVEKTEKLEPTLKKALDSKGVHLVIAPIDYSENKKVLTEELEKKVCLV
ncbi:acetolactate synthase large subunit [Candidatus Peregrinibacteria bacterium]|jgi:acetolactate synthase I/II/III large subunit|nr:acetolactate synthase large subunit [Candidatus Peregrinibacteria bacterium]